MSIIVGFGGKEVKITKITVTSDVTDLLLYQQSMFIAMRFNRRLTEITKAKSFQSI